MESLQHFKKPWAHEHEPVKTLLDAINVWNLSLFLLDHFNEDGFSFYYNVLFFQDIKPTVLIGTSGVGKQFTKEVVEAMATINEVFRLWTQFLLKILQLWNCTCIQ